MDELVIPIHDRSQVLAQGMDMLGHVAAAVGLVAATAKQFPVRTPGSALLVAAEVAAAAALVGVIVRELRHRRRGGADHEEGVDWISLFAGTVLLLDWFDAWRGGGKFISPTLLAAGIAFLQPRLDALKRRRRTLRITGDEVDLRLSRFRRFHGPWDGLREVTAEDRALVFVLADGGRRRVTLRRVINRDEVMGAVLAAAARRGLSPAPSSPPAIPAAHG
jgi:hypothetical protein